MSMILEHVENKIPFNRPVYLPEMEQYVLNTIKYGTLSGDQTYTKACATWMEERFGVAKVLMTTSCTSALEMCAILLNIQSGDEVIMPSYTFVSTANAFVLHGARIVFVDIRPDTMNIDERKIEDAITSRTKAIVVVHYAGVACEMDSIIDISQRHGIPVIEDAAQGVISKYKGKALGSIGSFGCYSFHETKNYTMGEGGALLVNDPMYIERAEIIREKGTNRSRFFRGQVDKYSWVDIGSSFLPSDLNAALLYPQLLSAEKINRERLRIWEQYDRGLHNSRFELPVVPKDCQHNAHMYYIKAKNLEDRQAVLSLLKKHGIIAAFHYVPLHSSEAGVRYGRFSGEDVYTTRESERLLRLPLWYGMKDENVRQVLDILAVI